PVTPRVVIPLAPPPPIIPPPPPPPPIHLPMAHPAVVIPLAPIINLTNVIPNRGTSNGSVRITVNGNNFIAPVNVIIGGRPCANVVLNPLGNSITCDTPAKDATAGDTLDTTGTEFVSVEVTNGDGNHDTLWYAFEYEKGNLPTITRINPATSASAGNVDITIEGTNFFPGSHVLLGATPCTHVTFVSGTQLLCTTSPRVTLNFKVDVSVVIPNNLSAVIPDGHTYLPDVDNLQDCKAYANFVYQQKYLHPQPSEIDIRNATTLADLELNITGTITPGIHANIKQRISISTFGTMHYKVNVDYLSKDPYLHLHNIDYNSLYPDLTNHDKADIRTLLVDAGMGADPDLQAARVAIFGLDPNRTAFTDAISYNLNMDGHYAQALNTAAVADQQAIFKRIKRLVAFKLGSADPNDLGKFAIGVLANNKVGNRCIDGVRDSLTDVEKNELGDESNEPVHFGKFFSKLFIQYREEFIDKHKLLFPGDPLDHVINHNHDEHKTVVPLGLKRKMHLSFGLRGNATTVRFMAYTLPNETRLWANAVLERFLLGGDLFPYGGLRFVGGDMHDIAINNFAPQVHFDAFDVNRMLQILKRSREIAFTLDPIRFPGLVGIQSYRSPNEMGLRLNHQLLTDLLQKEESLLGAAAPPPGGFVDQWQNFMANGFNHINDDGHGHVNDFFRKADPAPAGARDVGSTDDRNFYLTDDAWLYLLEKYGYIIRVP
ncbi:MAG: IPT/TIG domain-containing protein, partial [Oligoflexia bacterium]|nr:IPT/TIG domain-containing protein [Oligoflexia bacterium]